MKIGNNAHFKVFEQLKSAHYTLKRVSLWICNSERTEYSEQLNGPLGLFKNNEIIVFIGEEVAKHCSNTIDFKIHRKEVHATIPKLGLTLFF